MPKAINIPKQQIVIDLTLPVIKAWTLGATVSGRVAIENSDGPESIASNYESSQIVHRTIEEQILPYLGYYFEEELQNKKLAEEWQKLFLRFRNPLNLKNTASQEIIQFLVKAGLVEFDEAKTKVYLINVNNLFDFNNKIKKALNKLVNQVKYKEDAIMYKNAYEQWRAEAKRLDKELDTYRNQKAWWQF